MRRITPEGRISDFHPEVGRIWRSRHEEPPEEEFGWLPGWLWPSDKPVEWTVDARRLIPLVLSTLTEREEQVMRLRFWDGATLEECATHFGITRERIRQVEARALRKLRHPSRADQVRHLHDGVVPKPVNLDAIRLEAARRRASELAQSWAYAVGKQRLEQEYQRHIKLGKTLPK